MCSPSSGRTRGRCWLTAGPGLHSRYPPPLPGAGPPWRESPGPLSRWVTDLVLPFVPLSQLPLKPLHLPPSGCFQGPLPPTPRAPSSRVLQLGRETLGHIVCVIHLEPSASGRRKMKMEKKELFGVSGLTSGTLLPALGIPQQLKDKNNQN